ncbi:ABC transporter [Niallia circulans]|uniref:ABC transporter ATP-binding protein n=1 Tax=Niallia circulans TaxID=1397 RepID=A0A0J1IK79_NIACI|nr:ABC-F type ribosomal protection protein [Niallia circulans]KLV26359.1 ABC transporter ATP-binding protein [Niallia circulans]MDR4317521.1 ABC-F type ribosomal protection protein [Niallia circulans]MED3840568.1 ABC-F type ribosomal protection protein [Niallia circulans]MED4243572.1 ABC-F type ribosomal protection protein [Niallia circulans]MED4247441.1 ABC-F type ribosomal protection protein [Niallia circulans]
MIICSVNKIAKMYGGNTIFEDISIEIKEKEKVGLVGRNGSGKTTLFRLLAGKETPDAGQIHWKKGMKNGYLEQIPEFKPEWMAKDVLKQAFSNLVIIEEKMKQMEQEMAKDNSPSQLQLLIEEYGKLQEFFTNAGGYEMDAKIEKIVNGLNIQHLVTKKYGDLSGGERTKIGLAMILLEEPDFLLLDEPTNHLDLMAVEWLGRFLQDYSGTILLISHDRYFLDEVIQKVIDLEDGEVTTYHTNFTNFTKEKEERLLREFQAYEEQQKKIKKMREAIKRLREWANRANPPNEGLHKRARNMERAIERMEKLSRPNMNRKKMNFEMESSDRSGKDVIQLRNVSKKFGEQILFQDVQMKISYKDRAAIIGENGTGKSTLLKMILQQIKADEGEIKIGSNVKIGYLSQHTLTEMEGETVIEAFRNEVSVTEGEARHILAQFLFYGYSVFRKTANLSGGERMRLRLAQLMHQEINLLVLDEPTNHLDIDSREVLEDALENFDGTILAVSHDRYFLNKLFRKIYWIESQEIQCYEGNYTYAREKSQERKRTQVPIDETITSKKRMQPIKKRQRTESAVNPVDLANELEGLEKEISEVERRIETETEWESLAQFLSEKERLERRWEELYTLMNSK